MTFNTALTGLRAATSELNVTGNNIANSSTTGFKQSRVEFADVYANSVIGGGSNAIGNGVRVSDIAQQFSQGNISFTENALDMAINGGGFFVVNNQGSLQFTRAGLFGVDDQGFITTNEGALLQGFPANSSGVVSGVLGDIQLDTATIAPRQTTLIEVEFNLDNDDLVLAERGSTITSNGPGVGVVQVGNAGGSVTNGYLAGTLDLNGVTQNIPSVDDLAASDIVGELSALSGVSASATTTAVLEVTGGFPVTANQLLVNNVSITGTTPVEIAQSINAIAGFTASHDALTDEITITQGSGDNIVVDLSGGPAALSATVNGAALDNTVTNVAVVGGDIAVVLDEGVVLDNAPAFPAANVFVGDPVAVSFVNNAFDPTDQSTYNAATSVTVFDSLGSPHVMTQFFVKESSQVSPPNTWSMYVQIDGVDVGDPDPLAADPTAATLAQFNLRFNSDGSLDSAATDTLIISNWTPLDPQGNPAGALAPAPGVTTFADPPTNSNFLIDITGSTQFAGSFAVNELDQDGFATGQLAGVDISDTGIIFARYSNGEALTLGQVALANFSNEQGLTPLGDSSWAESFESGEPVIGAPRTASLGAITAGALEDSNVELAEELVSLIIAQRNFQANSRTIETANEITQTIINLR